MTRRPQIWAKGGRISPWWPPTALAGDGNREKDNLGAEARKKVGGEKGTLGTTSALRAGQAEGFWWRSTGCPRAVQGSDVGKGSEAKMQIRPCLVWVTKLL